MFAHGTNELRSSNGGGGGQPKVFVLFYVLSAFVLFCILKKTKIEMREGDHELGFERMKRENKKREERKEGEETKRGRGEKDKGSNGTQPQSLNFCQCHDNHHLLHQVTSPQYKTVLCQQFMEGNGCQFGESCSFAHGHGEVEFPTFPLFLHILFSTVWFS